MFKFGRNRNVCGERVLVDYAMYSRAEADELGIPYVEWRNAPPTAPESDKVPPSDYVKSWLYVLDDYGWVSPVLDGVSVLPSGRVQVNFVFGRRYSSKKPFGYGSAVMTENFDWSHKESRRERTKRVVAVYTEIIAQKGFLSDSEWDMLGNLYRRDEDKPKLTVKRLFKSKGVKRMVRDELVRLLVDADITSESVITQYKDVFIEAVRLGQLSVAKGVTDKFAEMLDLKPDKVNITDSLSATRDYSHLLEANPVVAELSSGTEEYEEEEEDYDYGNE